MGSPKMSVRDIIEVYDRRQDGESWRKIGKRSWFVYNLLEKNLSYKRKPKFSSINYWRASREILARPEEKEIQKIIDSQQPFVVIDPYKRLEDAFINFQNEVSDCIKKIVDIEVGEVKNDNEKLQKEVEELRQIEAVARRSNFIDNLRQHFNH